jgi:hypothetical protein
MIAILCVRVRVPQTRQLVTLRARIGSALREPRSRL